MLYETTTEGDFTIISLHGEIDMQYSRDARKQILETLTKKNNLLIDLSAVDSIDSSGVASLVEAYQTAQSKHLRFGLIGVSDTVMMVLKLAHLHKVFPIFDNVDTASNATT